MIRLIAQYLKYLWPIFIIAACIAIGLSCGRREAERMSTDNKMTEIDLDKYRWKNRLVLIFARSSEESFYLKQKSELERKTEEFKDRNILVIELLEEGGSKMAAVSLNHEQQSFLRRKFDVPVDDFGFILIGKDGNVKLRTKKPVLSHELFGLIDSMPMRKEEMRKKANRSQN